MKTQGAPLKANIIVVLFMLALPAVAQAQFTYTIVNGSITITSYTGPGGDVNIPSTIIGLPVTSIGDDAFDDITSLTSVTIPNSVTNIAIDAFDSCTNLTAITVNAFNSVYSSLGGVLFNRSQSTLIQCPEGIAGSYSVPNSVTSIGDYAFAACSSLTGVTIPDGVTSIGDWAFDHGTSLTSVTIGNGVTRIGDHAFSYCTSLTGVTIPDGVTSIGDWAFDHGTSLTSVTIGDGVTTIGDYAFQNCYNLISVTIPISITSIGVGPLNWCANLTAIMVEALNSTYSSLDGVLFNKSQAALIQYPGGKAGSYAVPNSVTSIGDWAFHGCLMLTNVTIPNSVTNIGLGAFEACGLTSLVIPNSITSIGIEAFCACDGLTNVVIPNSVTNIGQLAFYYCTGLTSVTIPKSVTSIGGDLAFAGCYSLTGVYFAGNAPSIAIYVFDSDNATVYYLPGTTGWGATLGGRPTVLWNPQAQTGDGSFGVHNNEFGFSITGSSNLVVVVEACTNLVSPTWIPVGNYTLDGGGTYFSDALWTNYPTRFYRLSSP
jgi:BspA type Leucine rich repeat region (6 copies)